MVVLFLSIFFVLLAQQLPLQILLVHIPRVLLVARACTAASRSSRVASAASIDVCARASKVARAVLLVVVIPYNTY